MHPMDAPPPPYLSTPLVYDVTLARIKTKGKDSSHAISFLDILRDRLHFLSLSQQFTT